MCKWTEPIMYAQAQEVWNSAHCGADTGKFLKLLFSCCRPKGHPGPHIRPKIIDSANPIGVPIIWEDQS